MPEYIIEGITPMPKKRPSFNGKMAFTPKAYQQWKRQIREYLAEYYQPVPIMGHYSIDIAFCGPNKPRGDIDNCGAAINDAIQPPRAKGDVRAQRALEEIATIEERLAASPGCLIADDKNNVDFRARWVKQKERRIEIRIEEA